VKKYEGVDRSLEVIKWERGQRGKRALVRECKFRSINNKIKLLK